MLLSRDVEEKLKSLGERLRKERLRRNESQRVFAARIGVSIPTLHKMEAGDPAIQFGYWAAALDVFDRAGELRNLLSPPEDLFAKYALMQKPARQRASRRVK